MVLQVDIECNVVTDYCYMDDGWSSNDTEETHKRYLPKALGPRLLYSLCFAVEAARNG